MLKRLFSIILAITIATGYLDVGINVLVDEQMMLEDMIVSAEEFDTEDVVLEGQTEEGITYLYNDEKVVITGYVGTSSDLVIPKEIDGRLVTNIAGEAFYNNKTIKKINIEARINMIPQQCFRFSNLMNIILPETLTKIDERAFASCYDLETINIPSEVTEIGNYAFCYCTNLKTITIPSSIRIIKSGVFNFCKNLEIVNIPSGVTTIQYDAFNFCENLKSIILPSTITSIGDSAFSNCTNLKSINIPSGVISIGGSAFQSCKELSNLNLPETIETIGASAFSYCTSITEIIIPNSVTSLGAASFTGCENLETIQLSSQLRIISEALFENCKSLNDINIPDSITEIKQRAFKNCINLSKLNIPSTVSDISNEAFLETNASLIIYGESESYAHKYALENHFKFIPIDTELTFIQDEQGLLYLITDNETACVYTYLGTNKNITIPLQVENIQVTEISPRAFEGNIIIDEVIINAEIIEIPYQCFKKSNISSVKLPETLKTIDAGAFAECINLKDVNIPQNITSLSSSVFYGCTKLTELNIPEGITEIPDNLCYSCTSLRKIIFPSTITKIGDYAFSLCKDLTEISLPNTITDIGNSSFSYCSSLSEIKIPDSITNISDSVFERCSSLTEITIPNKVTYIGAKAFDGCNALEKIVIPASVTEINEQALSVSSSSKLVIYGEYDSIAEEYATINKIIFSQIGTEITWLTTNEGFVFYRNTDGLTLFDFSGTSTAITIPVEIDGVPIIGIHGNVFARSVIKKVIIEADIQVIPDYCFFDAKLEEITLPKNLISIGEFAFADCDYLHEIELPESLISIGVGAFNNKSFYEENQGNGLNKITIPAGVTELKWLTFAVSSLEEITFLSDVVHIGDHVFAYTKLKNISLPDSIKSIGDYTFYGCKELTELIIPSNVTDIGEHALSSTSLTELVIPDSVTTIGNSLLSDTPITKINISSNVTCIPDGFARNCNLLDNITIPVSTHSIGQRAFQNCNKLSNIYIPSTTTTIHSSAFDNCYFLTITAPKDSYAITFAKENNIPYVEVTYGNDNESFESQIPSDVINQSGNQNDEWSVITDKVTAVFDIGSVIEIQHRHGNKNVTFSYKVVETVGNDEQQSVVEDVLENGGKVVDFSLVNSDGESIAFSSTENKGAVTITVPYTAPVSANKVTVYYIATDGTRTDMNGTYDPSTKTVTFTTTHFSLFAIESSFVNEEPEKSDSIGVTLSGCTLSLNGNIGVNFYMELSEDIAENSNAYIKFTLPNGNIEQVSVSESRINTTLTPGKTYNVFSCEVASYEMTQNIKVQMFDGYGNSSQQYTYTVKEYAEYIIGNPTQYTEKDIEFVKALLNYGACAQEYFKKEISNLANRNMNTDDRVVISLTPDDLEEYMVMPENNFLGSFAGYSLVLHSETTLKVFFKPSENIDTNNLTFKVNGQIIKPSRSEEYCVLPVNNIKAWDLDTNHTFTVSYGNENFDFSCSALSYAYSVLDNGSYPDTLIKLISALRVYQQKSEIYINK
ncbi:MAG: leucine-rich repeat domain-containing protein [Ruminococcus sp.]|nr:leucine-rich repeat domain-containing protein [Ruminococcus sp.]